jgi:hypothetical protein
VELNLFILQRTGTHKCHWQFIVNLKGFLTNIRLINTWYPVSGYWKLSGCQAKCYPAKGVWYISIKNSRKVPVITTYTVQTYFNSESLITFGTRKSRHNKIKTQQNHRLLSFHIQPYHNNSKICKKYHKESLFTTDNNNLYTTIC